MNEVMLGAFEDELEKIAIDPLTALIIGGASHLGSNAVVTGLRALRKVQGGRLSGLAASVRQKAYNQLGEGIKRGVKGSARPFSHVVGETLTAPELFANSHLGQGIGNALRGISSANRYKVLKKLRKTVAQMPGHENVPVMQDIVGGVSHALDHELPTPGKIVRPGKLRTIATAGLVAGAGALEPGAAIHAGLNRLRIGLATHKKIGKSFMRNGAVRGATDALGISTPNKIGNTLIDTLISPAARDSSRVSSYLTDTFRKDPRLAKKMVGALHPIKNHPVVAEWMGKAKDLLRERINLTGSKIVGKVKADFGEMKEGLHSAVSRKHRMAMLKERLLNRGAPGAPLSLP